MKLTKNKKHTAAGKMAELVKPTFRSLAPHQVRLGDRCAGGAPEVYWPAHLAQQASSRISAAEEDSQNQHLSPWAHACNHKFLRLFIT